MRQRRFKEGTKVRITNSTNPDSVRDRKFGNKDLTISGYYIDNGIVKYQFEESGVFILRESEISTPKVAHNDSKL